MPNRDLSPPARLLTAATVFIPSLTAGYGTASGLAEAGAPDIVAALPAGVVAVAGILAITHGIETWLNRQAVARAQEEAAR